MRIPNAARLSPTPETQAASTEESPPQHIAAPRYWPASEQRIAARFAPFVIQGSSGSQGRAILAQALINARRKGFEVIAISRDAGAFSLQPLHQTDIEGRITRTVSLSRQDHPALQLWPSHASADIPPQAEVFNSVVAHALPASVKDLPPGTKIFTGQNGVPNPLPPEKKFQRQYYISTLATSVKDHPKRATLVEGGALYFDERTPDRDYLEAVLGGGDLFALKFVPDIRVHQWRKIAFNAVNNTLCTLFGMTFGDLFEQAGKDPRHLALQRGMLRETQRVARARGIDPGSLDDLHRAVADTQRAFPAHHSSMHHALVSGQSTENAHLAGAIARDAQRFGFDAPLCALAAHQLDSYLAIRDRAGREEAGQFYERNRERVIEVREALLDLASRVIQPMNQGHD